ncbi:MAG: YHS domain-containing protein [Thermoprotei archaeon]
MNTDPVCHRHVDGETSFTVVFKRRQYVFCSARCHAEFKKSPEKYAEAEGKL